VSAVLQVIAQRYRSSRAGRRNTAQRRLIFPFNDLLKEAGCFQGTSRYEAIHELETLESLHIVGLDRATRDRSVILKVILPLDQASALFAYLGESSPEQERESLAATFNQAASTAVPKTYREGWLRLCRELSEAAKTGEPIQPFVRSRPDQVGAILKMLPLILNWQEESEIRFASSEIVGNSKTLEAWRVTLESCLSRITGGKIGRLADIGILDGEKSFLLHGPLSLTFEAGRSDLGLFDYPVRVGARDIARAALITSASKCLTIENFAMMRELAKLRAGTLLVSSGSKGGYANSAVIEFLRKLPATMELWHFGDSDPKGFDILRDLRVRSGRTVQGLHMRYRPAAAPIPLTHEDLVTILRLLPSENLTTLEKAELGKMISASSKGNYEQESLGRPSTNWPFYP